VSEFKIGDLIEFIPENFQYPTWDCRYVGIGYIERIESKLMLSYDKKIYYIYCSKLTRQQMKNFVEYDLEDKMIELTEQDINLLCKKLNS
jgi:hypothetical protein